jgi:2',3'-cyclic-nucleotide 2'-phosphodiesterase (5'-nucleotidase family)
VKRLGLLLGTWALGLVLAAQAPLMEHGAVAAVSAAVPDDPELAKVIAPCSAEISASFGRVIAQAPAGMARRGAPGEFPLGCFLADVMREGAAAALGLQVRAAITNAGGIRNDLPAGPVTVGAIYEVIPFEDELVVAEYTGAEVLAIVKEAILRQGGEPVSGIRAVLTGSRDHPLVAITWSDGTAIDPAGVFRVATSDYLLANAGVTPTLRRGRNVVLTSIDVRQALIEHCRRLGREGKAVAGPGDARYAFAPGIVQAIRARTLVL